MPFLLVFLQSETDSPPFVCSNVAASGKPGVEDENASESLTSPDPAEQGRVVRESEAFAEPVHRVLLPRALPCHRSRRGAGATPPCWQRPAGRLSFSGNCTTDQQDTEGTARDTA